MSFVTAFRAHPWGITLAIILTLALIQLWFLFGPLGWLTLTP